MKADYFRLKADLGRRPLRLDVHGGSDIPPEYLSPDTLDLRRATYGFWQVLGSLPLRKKAG